MDLQYIVIPNGKVEIRAIDFSSWVVTCIIYDMFVNYHMLPSPHLKVINFVEKTIIDIYKLVKYGSGMHICHHE